MNTAFTDGSGNRVVFLIAAVYNLLLTMNYGQLAEYALYMLIGNTIGAGVWFLFKLLADRVSARSKQRIVKPLKRPRK